MAPLLGCIADDFTGATDVASALVSQGLRTVQVLGVSDADDAPVYADAIVIALKTRTAPVDEAVRLSLAALRWLQRAGCGKIFFKYCSTFDSTSHGNIGPVAEAMMTALATGFTVACPAFPRNRRSIYAGYLFVGGVLLSESSMRNHPLTPMTDANLVRVLAAQAARPVGLIDIAAVKAGVAAVKVRMQELAAAGHGFAIADAIDDADLEILGDACMDLPFATGSSGLAAGIGAALRRRGFGVGRDAAAALPSVPGRRAVVSGSCSEATNRQVARMSERHPALALDLGGIEILSSVDAAMDWAAQQPVDQPILIYSTADPAKVKAIQARFGVERSSRLIETALAKIARRLVTDLGVRQMITAGGETSGAIVEALGVKRLRIGGEIDPGVPWTVAEDAPKPGALALALKSGNFGTDDFFLKAWNSLG
ncbi:MAG TPA: 3-oxo-tetronate kinase [Bradyrhizobium sp.]|nr:3-oxo-tetronate kinase [Bradyrhizobium sp.]